MTLIDEILAGCAYGVVQVVMVWAFFGFFLGL